MHHADPTPTTVASDSTDASTASRRPWRALAAAVLAAIAAGGAGVLVLDAPTAAVPFSTSSSAFVPIVPCRLLDTRPGVENVGQRITPLGAAETLAVIATGERGNCVIPEGATALSMNVVAISPTASSYLTVFPTGVSRPTSSSLNWVARQAPTPNAVTSALGTDGGLSFYNLNGTVDLAVDVVGYFRGATPPASGDPGPQGPQGPAGPVGVSANPPRVVHVATSGGQFETVSDALASITDASAERRYVIRIAPGTYDEAGSLMMKDFVDIDGAGDDVTVLRSASATGTIVVGTAHTTLRDLTVVNTGGLGIDALSTTAREFELSGVTIDVSGGSSTDGIRSDRQLVADDLTITATGAGSVEAVDVIGGSAELTALTIDINAGSACRAISASNASVTVSGADIALGGCELSFGLLGVTTSAELHDVKIASLASISAVGVWADDSDVIAGGLVVTATGGSTSHGIDAGTSTVFVSNSDIRSASIAVDGTDSDMKVTDSILGGTTIAMSTSCTAVLTTTLSTYTCT